jgi:hypothetical protein
MRRRSRTMGATVRTSLSYQLVSRERGEIKREEEACEGGELCPSFLAHCRRLLHPGKKRKSSSLPPKETEKKSRAVLVLPLWFRVVLAASSSTLGQKKGKAARLGNARDRGEEAAAVERGVGCGRGRG